MTGAQQERAWLLAYGKNNHYPALSVRDEQGALYAIGQGNDRELYEMQVQLVRDEVAVLFYRSLQANEDDLT